jgi:hypothetical protein
MMAGDFICELYGQVSMLEELDDSSNRPAFTQFWISGTPLMIDTAPLAPNAIYTRIRRSVFFNCDVRLFQVSGKSRVGLFAVGPTVLPLMAERPKRTEGFAIRNGDELLLPFDIMPVIQRFECDWRATRGKRGDVDVELMRPRYHGTIAQSDDAATADGAEMDTDKGARRSSEVASLVAVFADEMELPFAIIPGEGGGAFREHTELPAIVAKMPVPGRKPPLLKRPQFTAQEPPEWRPTQPEIKKPALQFLVLRELAGVRPREPWDLIDDCIDPGDHDLQH